VRDAYAYSDSHANGDTYIDSNTNSHSHCDSHTYRACYSNTYAYCRDAYPNAYVRTRMANWIAHADGQGLRIRSSS
jgi:hypothetical protein